jgi:hypothetical protein
MFTNSGFYFAWVAIAFFPLVIAIFVPETRRNRIIAILLTLVITFSFATLLYKQSKGEHDRWNNGIHFNCGGEYQFSSATNYRGSKDYYYTCDKCGHTEEFSVIMK